MPDLKFEFATATRIIFGAGKIKEIGSLAAGMGNRALVIIGVRNTKAEQLVNMLQEHNVTVTALDVTSEPSVSFMQQVLIAASQAECDLVIGFGGGSAMDTAKAAAALLKNQGDIYDYLEVIGKALPLKNRPLPCIAIPTTAGTGAEVTRNAVLTSPEQRVKVSLRSPLMLPVIALVDPELTLDLPKEITASTGLDALTQVIEPFVSNAANPLTDALCKEGMARAARSLRRAYHSGKEIQAREDLCITSLFGGLALANAKLGAVHGFAGVLGGMYPGPHGAICARLLPLVIESNLDALKRREPSNPAINRLEDVARILTGNPNAGAVDGLDWINDLAAELVVPSLSAYGLTAANIPEVVEKSAKASSMKGNPIVLTDEEMHVILERAL